MTDLTFTITGQRLTWDNPTSIASGTKEHFRAVFTFSAEWDALAKTAIFWQTSTVYAVVLTDGACTVPWEALQAAGRTYVTVIGVSGTERLTTLQESIRLGDSGAVEGETPPEPTPDVYQQIIAIMEQQAADALAAQTAEDGAQAAQGLAEDARDAAQGHAETASTKAGEAAGSAQAAAGSASEAEGFAGDADDFATLAANNILNGVDTHNQSEAAHADIRQAVQTAESIARGRATAHVFDTLADMTAWLAVAENVVGLVTGDNLYIRDTGVKDYWWDGESAQELEAEAPDLTDYYTKLQVDAMMPIMIARSAYDALVAAGTVEAGRVYDIYED